MTQFMDFFLKPINFDETKTYPLAVLIHGKPEGSYTLASWNPQIYTSSGYTVLMINPHGSVGLGDKFQDNVRFNWSRIPYEDVMMGITYIRNKYKFLDKGRICAAGASYGGYMINWIEGHKVYKFFDRFTLSNEFEITKEAEI